MQNQPNLMYGLKYSFVDLKNKLPHGITFEICDFLPFLLNNSVSLCYCQTNDDVAIFIQQKTLNDRLSGSHSDI